MNDVIPATPYGLLDAARIIRDAYVYSPVGLMPVAKLIEQADAYIIYQMGELDRLEAELNDLKKDLNLALTLLAAQP